MDALQEARRCMEAGDAIAVHERDEDVACYLAGINAALIAIVERLPPPTVQEEPKQPPRATAQDVFDHLPAELQEAIDARPLSLAEKMDAALPIEPKTRGRSKLFKT